MQTFNRKRHKSQGSTKLLSSLSSYQNTLYNLKESLDSSKYNETLSNIINITQYIENNDDISLDEMKDHKAQIENMIKSILHLQNQ